MRAVEVDERDSSWERHDPRFRVYVFTGEGNAVRTVDILDADIVEAQEATRALSEGDRHLWSLALVSDDEVGRRGLTWLSGMDYNDRVSSGLDVRRRGRMQDRYLSARVRRGEPPLLPNGLRVIRVFPEWGTTWPLWESFTDAYLLEPGSLPVSAGLSDALIAWNHEWQDRAEDAPLPDEAGWRARGQALAARLQVELAGIAEVRPEFLA